MMKKDDRLIENIRRVLDQSLEDLDGATSSRLTQARHLAMERQGRQRRLWYWGAFPVAATLLLVVLLNWPSAPLPPVAVPQFDVLNIMTAAEPLEFYQEEIEFYEWLSEELKADKELSDGVSLPAVPVAERGGGAAGGFVGTAEPGTARLSGVV